MHFVCCRTRCLVGLMLVVLHPGGFESRSQNAPLTSFAQDRLVAPSFSAIPADSAGSSAVVASLDDKHKLATGDRVSLRILEDREEPRTLLVADSGEIEVPYLGRWRAVQKTCRQIATELKTELEKDYYYQATVVIALDLLTRSRGRVYLVGAIRAPGPQEIPSDEVFTVSKAVLRAGGFSDFADKRRVKVTRETSGQPRNEPKTIVVNVGEILEQGRTDLDLKLEPGDMIFVPARLVNL